MTRIRGLDACLTPEYSCDPHAPFDVVATHSFAWGAEGVEVEERQALVYDGRDPGAPPLVRFAAPDAMVNAAYYADTRNREVSGPNSDGPGGSCTVCGDWHGHPE